MDYELFRADSTSEYSFPVNSGAVNWNEGTRELWLKNNIQMVSSGIGLPNPYRL